MHEHTRNTKRYRQGKDGSDTGSGTLPDLNTTIKGDDGGEASKSGAFREVNGHTLQHLRQRPQPEWDCIDCPERHANPQDFEDVGCADA